MHFNESLLPHNLLRAGPGGRGGEGHQETRSGAVSIRAGPKPWGWAKSPHSSLLSWGWAG